MPTILSPLERALNVNHPANVAAQQAAAARRLNVRDAEVLQLSEITNDMGTIQDGDLIFGNSTPDDPSFTGIFISSQGYMFGSGSYNVGGVNNGSLEFGISSVDGTALFSGGAGVIGANGIVMNGLYYPVQFSATNSGNQRTGRLGMTLLSGGTVPVLQLDFESVAGSNLMTNSSNPSALTGWTNPGGWQVNATDGYGTDTASFQHDPTNQTAPTLLNQVVTGLSANTYYTFSGASRRAFGYLTPRWFLVWRDSSHNVLRTDTVSGNGGSSWQLTSTNIYTPASTAECLIELDYGDPFQDFRYDAMSLAASGVVTQMEATDAGWQFESITIHKEQSANPTAQQSGYTNLFAKSTGVFYQRSASLAAPRVDGLLSVTTSEITVVNSAVETDMVTYTVPANLLGTDGYLEYFVELSLLNNTGGNQNLQINLYFGGVSLTLFNAAYSASAAARPISIWYRLKGNGATNAQIAEGTLMDFTQYGTGRGAPQSGSIYGTYSIDTTADQIMKLTAKLGAAGASLSVTRRFSRLNYWPQI